MTYELLKKLPAGPEQDAGRDENESGPGKPEKSGPAQWALVVQGITAALIRRTKNGWTATSPHGRTLASLCETKEECVRQVLNQA